MTRSICLRVAYEGTRFSGWQVQPGQVTVQGVLAEAIRKVTGEEILPRGSSRTDSGVHALGQVVAFTSRSDLEAGVWVNAINANLPPDVTVLSGSEVSAEFDPVWAAVRKFYRYRIHDAPWRPVLSGDWPLDGRVLSSAACWAAGAAATFASGPSTGSWSASGDFIKAFHCLTSGSRATSESLVSVRTFGIAFLSNSKRQSASK